jgi:hypothetical protein
LKGIDNMTAIGDITDAVLRRVAAAVGPIGTVLEMPEDSWPNVGRSTLCGHILTDNVHVFWAPEAKPNGRTARVRNLITDGMEEYPDTEMLPLDELAITYIVDRLVDGIRARNLRLFVKPGLPLGAHEFSVVVDRTAGLAIRGWLDRPKGVWLMRFDIYGARA